MMESSFLCLKWNNRESTWTQSLSDLRHKEFYTDATLTCQGSFFAVHKLILSMCSDYFREIFQRTYCKSPVVVLTGIRPSELSALIDYMYNGEVEVRQNEVTELLNAAQTLGIKGLTGPNLNLQNKYSKKTKSVEINCDDSSRKRQRTVSNIATVEPTINDMPDQNNAVIDDSDTGINPSIVLVETVRSEEAQRALTTVSGTCDTYELNVQHKQGSNDVTMDETNDGSGEADEDIVTEPSTTPDNLAVALREAYETNFDKIQAEPKNVAVIKVSSSQRKKSDVWNHFKTLPGKEAQCNYCKKNYVYKNGTTSNLRQHLRGAHLDISKYQRISNDS